MKKNMGQTENVRECSECANMFRPNLIIPHPLETMIRRLIKKGDKRRNVPDIDGGWRQEYDTQNA